MSKGRIKIPSGLVPEVRRAFESMASEIHRLQGITAATTAASGLVVAASGTPITTGSGHYVYTHGPFITA